MSIGTPCPVKNCDLPELHSFVKVSANGTSILHLHDPDPCDAPVTCWFDKGDLGYMVDALIDAADRRREKGGRLHERIADHLEEIALRLDDIRPTAITSAMPRI